LAALHETVTDTYKTGLIDEKIKKEFDATCLKSADAEKKAGG